MLVCCPLDRAPPLEITENETDLVVDVICRWLIRCCSVPAFGGPDSNDEHVAVKDSRAIDRIQD